MILIHPPVAKPSEPPGGIARLSGALTAHGIRHKLLDANLEALLYTLQNTEPVINRQPDKWTSRAFRNLTDNLAAIKDQYIYQNIDRYKRTVIDLNHVVEMSLSNNNSIVGLSDYRHKELSPLRSTDLIRAAENPELNPYYPYFTKRLPAVIKQESSTMIGFSLNYLSQALCTFAMIGFLKQQYPMATIILGGGLVTSWMSNPHWKNPFAEFVDDLIAGPGEHQLLSLIGVARIKKRDCIPDFEALPLNDYLSPGLVLPYNASTGCYWNKCSFCPEKAESNPYIPMPVKRVMEEISRLVARTKPVLVHLLDNAVSPALLKRIAENPFGIPWYGFARIDRHLTDIDFCTALKQSGCIMLKLGLESGDQGVLDKMHKGIDLNTASLALKTLKKAGIATYIYLIFGTPAETLPEARKTLEFIAAHHKTVSFLNLAIFNMPACGAEIVEFETSSFYESDLSLYTDFVHPKGWNRKQVRQFLNNEFKKHKAVAEIIKKDPPLFTSNHAPFFKS